jgi:hypothetical protein
MSGSDQRGHDSHAGDGNVAGHGRSHGEHQVDRRQQALPGLASSDAGLRLEAQPVVVAAGEEVRFEFRIVRDPDDPVTAFDELHERRMHLIVLRRDLTGFQHLHPEMDEAGTWRTSLRLPSGGAWRAFADFSTEASPTTLGVDVLADGDFRPERLPEPSTTARAGDHVVSLQQDDLAGLIRFTVTRDGVPVKVEPYLGAMGHLVAVRSGDLAFLHVHPVGDDITFSVTYPSSGWYRLFLQYLVEEDVRTASFTVAAG